MGDGNQVGGPPDAVEDVLLLAQPLPQRKIEPLDPVGADRQLMMLAEIVAVLIDRDGRDALVGSDVMVIGDTGHGVSTILVRTNDIVVGLASVGEPAPCAAMRVQIRELPRPVQMSVRIPDGRTGKTPGRRKPIDGREQVWKG